MEFKHTLEVLYNQADEIRKMAEKLAKAEKLRHIDLDLILDKLRNIYDLILDLEASLPAKKIIDQEIEEDENLSVVSPDKQTPGTKQQEIQPLFEIKQDENKTPVESDTIPVTPVKKSVEDKSPVTVKSSDGNVISDRFRGTKHTLHEQMAVKSKQEDISSQYKSKPISNILGAIALNERFELINQLFNGDKIAFEKTMEVLNTAGSFVEAYNYLQENFKWDMDNEYVQRILELIRRKLIVRRNE